MKQSSGSGNDERNINGATRGSRFEPPGGRILEGLTRAIHFVDIENLIRSPRPSQSQVRAARELYRSSDFFHEGDLVVIACNHGASSSVAFGWPDARLKIRSGQDGADLALLDAIDEEGLPHRFTRVVVASGDGIFADTVSSLAQYGIEVSVVAPVGGPSKRLRLAASRHSLIDTDRVNLYPAPGEAA